VIGVFVSVLAAGQAPAPDFRLPKIARPTRYQLDLTVVPSMPSFQGYEVIGPENALNIKEGPPNRIMHRPSGASSRENRPIMNDPGVD